ncbi:hypothetical protein [Burkholderia gladioli]|uniref:hypothetical protein n=1 Tax=Burkholderia gladioli TaxID=28095 RepID=UPI00163F0F62|nr:hypothetical protein [Burkholderia gladioli]
MNDETKQDQQQQQGAAQEVGGAESGESSGSTTAVSASTDGATLLPASDASGSMPTPSGAATSRDPDGQEVGGAAKGESDSVSNADGDSQTDLGSSSSTTLSKESSSEATNLQSSSGVSPGDYANGLQCSWHGKATADMSRDELIAFIGMLDDYATRLANAAQGVGTDSQTEQLTAAHPIHTVLAELESEIERPGAILKARVKSLINDARALF